MAWRFWEKANILPELLDTVTPCLLLSGARCVEKWAFNYEKTKTIFQAFPKKITKSSLLRSSPQSEKNCLQDSIVTSELKVVFTVDSKGLSPSVAFHAFCCCSQTCPDGAINTRRTECARHNRKKFAGQSFVWEPMAGGGSRFEKN